MRLKYSIDTTTDHIDEDGFAYHFVASGNSLTELIDDACFFLVDQDGGERGEVELLQTNGVLWCLGMNLIQAEIQPTVEVRMKKRLTPADWDIIREALDMLDTDYNANHPKQSQLDALHELAKHRSMAKRQLKVRSVPCRAKEAILGRKLK